MSFSTTFVTQRFIADHLLNTYLKNTFSKLSLKIRTLVSGFWNSCNKLLRLLGFPDLFGKLSLISFKST